MTNPELIVTEAGWTRMGRNAAAVTGRCRTLLVVGGDISTAAAAAIGLAGEQALLREVTIADLGCETSAIEALAAADMVHGLSDYFMFGTSLRHIVQPALSNGTLKVIISGTDSMAQEELLRHHRWNELLAHFRNSGELLVLVAGRDTPGLDGLSLLCEGTVLVDGCSAAGFHHVVGEIGPEPAAASSAAPSPARRRRSPSDSLGVPRIVTGRTTTWDRVHRWPVALLILVSIAGVAAAALVPLPERFGGSRLITRILPASATVPGTPTAPVAPAEPAVSNPEDALIAAAYSVELTTLNTRSGARLRLDMLEGYPAATIAPVIAEDGGRWFKVYIGAEMSRAAADALQSALEEDELLALGSDRVVALPYALLLRSGLGAEEAQTELQRYISLDIPAYLLTQEDGSVRVYAGAFSSPGQAGLLHEICSQAGVEAGIAYRTGRFN